MDTHADHVGGRSGGRTFTGRMIAWIVAHPVLATLALTGAIEAVTCWGRFVHDVQSTRDTRVVGRYTRGLRVHHCYVGGAMLALALVLGSTLSSLCACVGAALVLSDLVHHFAVLWPATGNHSFDLTYPSRED